MEILSTNDAIVISTLNLTNINGHKYGKWCVALCKQKKNISTTNHNRPPGGNTAGVQPLSNPMTKQCHL